MPPREGPRRGSTPAGFREQLLQRLRSRARQEGVAVQRLQHRVAFERLLARLADDRGAWVLKGGFALELRYGWRHRSTQDLDLRVETPLAEALGHLRQALTGGQQHHQGDHFTFELGAPGPEMQGAPGGAWRVPVTARVAGQIFARFHIDLSSGDAMVQPPETREGSDLLDFAGVPHVHFPIYPLPQQLAEKLHAYTLPRVSPNTRTKDLVDLVVVAAVERVDGADLLESLRATFDARRTHDVPATLTPPDPSWTEPFRRLASEAPISPTADLGLGFALVRAFWSPVLRGVVAGRQWDPDARDWRR
jgi:hypothetical protein